MEKDASKTFRELKDDVYTFAELKLELLKLNTYERIGKVISILSYGFLLSALFLFTILFAFLALGFLLSNWLDSTAAGFGIVAALYLLQVALVILNKNSIKKKVLNAIITALNSNEQKKDATTDEPQPENSNIISD